MGRSIPSHVLPHTTFEIEMVAARGQFRIASAYQLRHYHARSDEILPDTLPLAKPVPVIIPGQVLVISDFVFVLDTFDTTDCTPTDIKPKT